MRFFLVSKAKQYGNIVIPFLGFLFFLYVLDKIILH